MQNMNNNIILPEGYKPSEQEEYMNPLQLEYFKQKLLKWREDLLSESRGIINHLQQENWHEPDLNDRAATETEASMELHNRDRSRKLLDKIELALQRIDTEEYGYCEITGEEIGLPRLEARPVATLSIECQESHERHERSHHNHERTRVGER